MSLAAIAAGADGLIIEVHESPECAWSDRAQSLKPDRFAAVIEKGPGHRTGHRPGCDAMRVTIERSRVFGTLEAPPSKAWPTGC